MTTQSVGNEGEPLFPMPPSTEQALRVAVMSLDPAAAVRFENEFHAAWQEAVQTDSTVPMHTFLHRWASSSRCAAIRTGPPASPSSSVRSPRPVTVPPPATQRPK